MKIALLTTAYTSPVEHERIQEEIQKMGYGFELVSLSDFRLDIKECAQIEQLDKIKADVVILRWVSHSIKTICEVVSSLREKGVRVFDNNLFTHRYSIDKVVDLVKLANAGVPVPRTIYARTNKALSESAEKLKYPLIAKSPHSGKGAGVFKVDSDKKLQSFLAKPGNRQGTRRLMLQAYIPYEYDLRILLIGRRCFAMRRIPREGEFRANFSLGGTVERFELSRADLALARKSAKVIGLAVAGVDVLITSEGKRYVLEVNHTPGMVGMEKATGENVTKVYLEYAVENAR